MWWAMEGWEMKAMGEGEDKGERGGAQQSPVVNEAGGNKKQQSTNDGG
jgi:hypothetical protein